jgi:hypothetical protein
VRVKWRWMLPAGNALIDCVLLLALASYSDRLVRPKGQLHTSAGTESAMFNQEGIPWEPANLPPSGPYLLIVTGNLPAGIISEMLAAHRGDRRHWQQFDAVWVLVYETASFISWYAIGFHVEGRRRLSLVLMAYIIVRFLLAIGGAYEVGLRVQVLFWLGCTAWLLGLALLHMTRSVVRGARRT